MRRLLIPYSETFRMSKAPPGVKRVVSVLNFFAEHPGQSFTFTDVVKALKLGRATCHALLTGLVEEQYLYRSADKTYVIGPALAAVGKIVSEQFSPLQAVQPEMRVLADEFHTVCTAGFLEHGNIVIRARAGSGSRVAWSGSQGHMLPLRAPFAAAFFAWSKDYEVAKWLDQLSPPASERENAQLRASMEFIRQHGYTYGVHLDGELGAESVRKAVEMFISGKVSAYPVESKGDIDLNGKYPLAFVTTSVFDSEGKVAFVLTLSGFEEEVSGHKIDYMGSRLREAAERITEFATGKKGIYPSYPI